MENQTEMLRFEIAKLELNKGDFLVFRFFEEPDADAIECLTESLRAVLPEGITALIMSDGIEITKVTHEETLD